MQQVAKTIEKVLWTFVQAFAVSICAVGTSLDWTVATAAAAAGIAAVITLGLAAVTEASVPTNLTPYADVILRVTRTAVAAFLSYLLVEPDAVLSGRVWQGALGAAGVALLAGIKGEMSMFVGNVESAATLPAWLDPVSIPPGPTDHAE